MINVTSTLAIDEKNLQWQFIQAGGPGGQNVNKVATAVRLTFDVKAADLPPAVEERLTQLAGQQMTKEGQLVILARDFRHQAKNREAALNRLLELLRRAAKKPKKRRPTRPSKSANERRLQGKRRQSLTKRLRRSVQNNGE